MPTGIDDFDFLIGTWRVRHERLAVRLAGSDDWERFEGSCVARKILGGAGNIDDNVLELKAGAYRAVSLRTFDPVAGVWSIWWLDGRRPSQLDTPVTGRFEHSVGTFFADDVIAGKPVRIRFQWTNTDTDTPRWEQAFSDDGGRNWEINWTMEFSRA